ncbi:MAG: hypothetical protein IJC35_08530 [Oscillospiraceae bacterium]|nr:hypothetical protein [Oscillospiraceae bacterium]
MARDKRIYRSFRPGKLVVRLILILIAAAIALSVIVYFWFKSYIVYTDDGLYLDIPWLYDVRGVPDAEPSDTVTAAPAPPSDAPSDDAAPSPTMEIHGIPETAATGTPESGQTSAAP